MITGEKALYSGGGVIFACVFVWLYAWLGVSTGHTNFNSPDETANYFFITRFAAGESVYYTEPLNNLARGLIHPRSMNVVGERVVPGSFMGMIFIYGSIAKLLGTGVIPWLTPFFSVVGVIFFGLLIARIFSREVGVVSALLAASFAPWWYVAARGMYHNTLFVSLLIMGIYWLVRFLERERDWRYKLNFATLAGFFLGLSLLTRLSEVGWVISIVILMILVKIKKIYWPGLILFLSVLSVTLIPFIAANYQLYGSALTIGYQTIGGGNLAKVFEQIHFIGFAKLIFAPFGFVPGILKFTVISYLIKIFWWWAALACIGFLYWLFTILPLLRGGMGGVQDKSDNSRTSPSPSLVRRGQGYAVCFLCMTVLLVLFYGSWGLVDRIDRSQFSIGTSFVRYWLPIYLGALPFIAMLLIKITSWARTRAKKNLLLALLIGAWVYASFGIVMRDTDESLWHLQKSLTYNAIKADLFVRELPGDAIYVIYPQLDKVMFPHFRRIITALVVPEDYASVKRLLDGEHVYYLTFASPETVATISRRDFEPQGMRLVEGRKLDDWDWVYTLIKM